MATSELPLASSAPGRRYLRAPVPLRFPEEEEVPETGIHFRLRTALWSMLRLELGERAIVGSDQFLYWDPTDPKQCLAPDVLVWVGAPDRPFPTWKVWERGAPHLAVEVVSDHDTRDRHWEKKLAAYRRSGVFEVARFDADARDRPLRLWDHIDGDLVERELSERESFRSDALGLFWLVEQDPELGTMLRLSRDVAGKERLLTDAEALGAARAQSEARIRELEAELAKRSSG